jgi:hypothetical protein
MKAEQLKDLAKYLREAIRYLEAAADLVEEQSEKLDFVETSCRGGQRSLQDDLTGEKITP